MATADNQYSYVIDQNGRTLRLPTDQLGAALDLGYQPASPEAAAAFEHRSALHQKYSTPGQAAIAGLEGAADALTLGASTWAEKALGVDTEGIKAREELNPVAHGLGAGVGLLAPLVLTGGGSALAEGAVAGGEAARGAGLLARAAEYTAPSLISKVGGAVTKAAGSALEKEGASALSQALRKTAASGLGAAAEGALYGVGEVDHEAAINPKLTAEQAIATVGLSTVLGGGLGAGLGIAHEGLATALTKARSATERVHDLFLEKYPAIGARLSGATEEDVAHLLQNRDRIASGVGAEELLGELHPGPTKPAPFTPGELPPEARFTPRDVPPEARFERGELPPEAKYTPGEAPPEAQFTPGERPASPTPTLPPSPQEVSHVAKDLTDSLEEQLRATREALSEASRVIRPAETSALAASVAPEAAQAEANRLYGVLGDTIKEMRAKPELFPPMYPAKLALVQDGLVREAAEAGPAGIFKALNEAKQNLDALAKFSRELPPEHADAVAAVRSLRAGIRRSLENEAVWGEAGARQAAYNNAFSEFKTAEKQFNKHFAEKFGTKAGTFEYRADPAKVQRFLRGIDRPENALKLQAFEEYQQASRALNDEIEKSAATFGPPDHDPEALKSILDRSGQSFGAARENAAVARTYQQAVEAADAEMAAFRDRVTTFRAEEAERRAASRKALEEFEASELGKKGDAREVREAFKAAEAQRQSAAEKTLAQFKLEEAERKAASKKALEEFKASEAERKSASREDLDTWRTANKEYRQQITRRAGLLEGPDSSPLMDLLGAGAVGHQPLLAPVFGAYKAGRTLASPIRTAKILASLERTGQAISRRMDTAITALTKGGHAAAAKGVAIAESPEILKKIENLNELTNNPPRLMGRIERNIAPLNPHAPQTAQASATTIARAVSYLQSIAPQPRTTGPLGAVQQPSRDQLLAWNKAYETIQDPMRALEQHPDRETIKTIQAVYPALHSQLQQQVVEQLLSKPDLTYQQRLRVSAILGINGDGTTTPEMVRANLLLSQAAQQNTQPKPKSHGTHSGLHTGMRTAKFTGAGSARTPMQHIMSGTHK